MEGVPPFAIYDPGADTAQNNSRRQAVRAVTVHTTQGLDSRGLGKTRHHNTPGTFNFLVRDDAVYCYYPAWVRCSHAAGSNRAGPGIENEGYVDTPMSAAKLANLGKLAHWLDDTYATGLNLYDGPDIAVDGSGFRGFVNHKSVAAEPQYEHTDRIPPNEWARAIGGAGTSQRKHDMMLLFVPGPPATFAIWTPPSSFVPVSKAQHDNLKEQGVPSLWTDKLNYDKLMKQCDDYWKLMLAAAAPGTATGGAAAIDYTKLAAAVAAGVNAAEDS